MACHRTSPAKRIATCTASVALLLLLLAPLVAGAEEAPAAPLRQWAFGWDPGDYERGLTVRYRFTPRWDLSVAAGPNDYRTESERLSWDSDDESSDDGTPRGNDTRQEQGWVRLAAGGQFWQEGRWAVSGVGAATYTWSVEDRRTRTYQNYAGALWDYRNIRESTDRETWIFTLGIRPSFRVSNRMQIEAEAGLRFSRSTAEFESLSWWDSFTPTERGEETTHYRDFQSYGGVELYKLKLIFWF